MRKVELLLILSGIGRISACYIHLLVSKFNARNDHRLINGSWRSIGSTKHLKIIVRKRSEDAEITGRESESHGIFLRQLIAYLVLSST
jgi:hypothetical protein